MTNASQHTNPKASEFFSNEFCFSEAYRDRGHDERAIRDERDIQMKTILLVLMMAVAAFAQKPEWQGNLEWSIGNHTSDPGMCNCVDQYVATEAACITGGGRACLMQ